MHLAAEGLALERGGRLLFQGLDLALAASDGVAVTGPNGAGKSSLLRCLAGLLAPTAGRIHRQAQLALADERLPLDPELPLARALAFWAAGDISPAVNALGLAPLAEVPVRILSSGQRKRAALALAASAEAPVWLLDEPLNALDAPSARALDRLIAEHREAGGAVVVATHQPLGGEWRRLELGR
ncbi:heme ABC exporter ATP-binding protein CcmA [Sphingomonas swuensis]|uniref:Heme ABC exporter ATP-binding protein CcmA n=1 Tax=Sphingomonas swuensis TaxID=977800 RepID=A0ABP7TDI0_9SPHN